MDRETRHHGQLQQAQKHKDYQDVHGCNIKNQSQVTTVILNEYEGKKKETVLPQKFKKEMKYQQIPL